jgi:flagellar hook-length control protein FliK
LQKLLQSNEAMSQALEDIASEFQSETPTPSPAKFAQTAEAFEAFQVAHADIIFKLTSRNVSSKAGNIVAAEELENNPRALEDALESATEGTLSDAAAPAPGASTAAAANPTAPTLDETIPASDLAALRNGASPSQILAQMFEAFSANTADERTRSLFAVTHGLNGSAESGFDLPVRLNGRISHLKMYVVGDGILTGDGARIFMSLDTTRLGTVSTYFTLTENGLNAAVSVETETARQTLEAHRPTLIELAQRADVNLGEIKFTLAGAHE